MTLLKQISSLVEEIRENAEGLDPNVLLEAIHVTEFSKPVDGDTLLEEMRNEGLL